MSDLPSAVREHLRAHILAILQDLEGREANDVILLDLLRARGVTNGADVLRRELEWLAEADCVALRDFGELLIAEITPRGLQVASDQIKLRGIGRLPTKRR